MVPFAECVMFRVLIDPPRMRRKLDGQWLKGLWVGRTEESDTNIVLIPEGIVTGKSVRRLAPEQRYQAELMERVTAEVQDPILSQAKLLRILPCAAHVRMEGETEMVPPQPSEMATADAAGIDDSAQAAVVPGNEVNIMEETGAEEGLGDAMAMAPRWMCRCRLQHSWRAPTGGEATSHPAGAAA